MTGAGSTVANSINFVTGTIIYGRNVWGDGSVREGVAGTATGPAALATGLTTVTVTVPGAQPGDAATASLNAATAGVRLPICRRRNSTQSMFS